MAFLLQGEIIRLGKEDSVMLNGNLNAGYYPAGKERWLR